VVAISPTSLNSQTTGAISSVRIVHHIVAMGAPRFAVMAAS
jgi:hypothetical protein